jgi:hypothetical protein
MEDIERDPQIVFKYKWTPPPSGIIGAQNCAALILAVKSTAAFGMTRIFKHATL